MLKGKGRVYYKIEKILDASWTGRWGGPPPHYYRLSLRFGGNKWVCGRYFIDRTAATMAARRVAASVGDVFTPAVNPSVGKDWIQVTKPIRAGG